jgi:hypothetical protein
MFELQELYIFVLHSVHSVRGCMSLIYSIAIQVNDWHTFQNLGILRIARKAVDADTKHDA